MELYIIRHGETSWNAAGRLQGRTDIELDQHGIDSAKDLGEELKDIHFDCFFSSPLKRAFTTAQLIRGDRNIPIIKDDRLIEICFGVGEGKRCEEWMDDTSPYRFFFTAPEKYPTPEGGESLEDVCRRTKEFVQQEIETLYGKAERIMIVAHGALNKGMMCYLQNHGIEKYWGKCLQKNCQASVFDFDGKNWKTVIE